ncbi:Nucleoside-diphosphate-sugar epimerase [Teratosphaeria destructans]|uniref:Nucleoside-diphosphate-sugar epimerase n=1 Tax=Teratosphaeria destructans TaxID=418781 RepID=A0A9W7SS96_9PEZI|nr:Nucleoside-diphosphate-sugar epimerase [Teratosphaeria destructans]
MTKIFLLGATGYIGGDALYAIAHAHPEYDITALVRNSDKGAVVAKEYPSIRLVYGDLDDSALLEEEAKKADIVAHFAHADHEGAANAIAKGLASRTSSQPGFFIHTSGTGILLFNDIRTGTYGEALDTVYDDLEHVSEVTSLPDDAPHRNVDKIVLQTGITHADRVKTAIVCPPTIYGRGRGPDNKRSHQIPELIASTLKLGHGFQVGAGKTYWGNVNVHDLSDLYLKLVESAAAGGSLAEWPEKPALWGARGYYFCEGGEHVWGKISKQVAIEAKKQGFTKTDDVKSVSKEEADTFTPWGSALWGANSRARAKRARIALKWKPTGASVGDTIKESVEFEAKRLGLKPGHAAVAAGNA